MKNIYLIIIGLIILLSVVYLVNKEIGKKEPENIFSSICNGTLEEIKISNPKEFLKIYDEVKLNNSTVLKASCDSWLNIIECADRQAEFLKNANCMAKFLKQSDLSEKEIKELRERTEK